MTDARGFEQIYAAALRSVGVGARLNISGACTQQQGLGDLQPRVAQPIRLAPLLEQPQSDKSFTLPPGHFHVQVRAHPTRAVDATHPRAPARVGSDLGTR